MLIIASDLDYTLSDKFSFTELYRGLEESKIIKRGFIDEIDDIVHKFHDNLITYEEGSRLGLEIYAKYSVNVPLTKVLEFLRNEFHPEQFLYPWVPELVGLVKKNDALFVIVSSSLDIYLEALEDYLRFDSFFANQLETRDGLFTGKYSNTLLEKEKGRIVNQLLQGNNSVISIGDSEGDLDMLASSTKGILFNPREIVKQKASGKFEIADNSTIIKILQEVISEYSGS